MDKEPGSAAPSADGRLSLVVKSVWPWSSDAWRQAATGAEAGSEAHPRSTREKGVLWGGACLPQLCKAAQPLTAASLCASHSQGPASSLPVGLAQSALELSDLGLDCDE